MSNSICDAILRCAFETNRPESLAVCILVLKEIYLEASMTVLYAPGYTKYSEAVIYLKREYLRIYIQCGCSDVDALML